DSPEDLPRRIAHPASRLEDIGGHGTDAAHDVPDEDEERVAHKTDLGGEHRESGVRHEEREEREARDRVQNPGEERDRRIERREAHGGEREGERDDQTDADGDRGELEMLADAEADLAGMVRDPIPADERFVGGYVASSPRSMRPSAGRVL